MNKQTGALETGEQDSSSFWVGLSIQVLIIGACFLLAGVVIFVLTLVMRELQILVQEDVFDLATARSVLLIGAVLFLIGWFGQHKSS